MTPPRSFTEWADLVRATVAHLVDRYGLDEVRGWPIEVWNEPNLVPFAQFNSSYPSISEEAGNAWVAWAEMGRPRSPRARQLDALREAAEPARTHRALPVAAGRKEQP